MEGIIGKESESILRFFILLENIQVKMDQLMEGNARLLTVNGS